MMHILLIGKWIFDLFGGAYATCDPLKNILPVDVVVNGCPPTPTNILVGILSAITPCK